MAKIRFVCGTLASAAGFSESTALGRCLNLYQYSIAEVRLFAENRLGLPEIYNIAIQEAANDPATLVFAHDDIFISDFFWPSHLLTALNQYQVIGVAGNRRRLPKQPGWPFIDEFLSGDNRDNLSGIVAHGNGFPSDNVHVFGPPGECKLLDGVFLAAHSQTLIASNLRFDERFKFHFYDMDFCRSAEQKGLRMGTANISVIHQSQGDYRAPAWRAGLKDYLNKWGE